MTSNTNISSDKSEAQLYEKKIYISHSDQEISGLEEANKNVRAYLQIFLPLAGPLLMNFCINTSGSFSAEGVIQKDLLLNLVEDIILIWNDLSIDGNPILEVALQSNKTSMDISYGEIFNLLLYLEEDIIEIQEGLSIIGYSN
ncbi:hypothetical protein C1645_822706 [Glomus cerebriforme]|uniref:Uncharacterized protein n=1 Tax=Glomus cerebriforme TaxID=658196 RepID=A0A397SY09_9GLOM|nr:hypothetical protein C1645_822706 [Glomus cerebriforme]